MLGGDRLEIRLLAQSPRILVGTRPVDAGSPKARLVLAVLAGSVGRVVPTVQLIGYVWGQEPPAAVRGSVHAYASRLRRAFRDAGSGITISSRAHGYVLEADPDAVDLHRAERWSARAGELARRGRQEEAAALLGDALDLWDGEPLTEVDGEWAQSARGRIAKLWRRLLAQWAEAKVELGEYQEVVDRLADADPEQESLVYLRMRALAAAGRQADALDSYAELRARRRETQGGEPNERTQRLFQELLERGDRTSEALGPAGPSVPAGPHVPVQAPPPAESPAPAPARTPAAVVRDNLDPDIPDFVARDQELAALVARAQRAEAATVVQVIEGAPATGKTRLAIRAAHLVRDRFDIRLQIRLRGADGHVEPMQALFTLLRTLGVPQEKIPAEEEARVALWRSRVARNRTLLVLDDAFPGQVGPLLPGVPGCAVLVTSRYVLTDVEAASTITLRELDPPSAARMFTAFTGRDRAEPGVERLLSVLGGLPLALRLGADRLRMRCSWTPDHLADRIRQYGITEFTAGQRSLRSVFALSYDELSPQGRAALLLLGMHPPVLVPFHAVAAVAGDACGAETALEELIQQHLVEEPAPGRYRVHDRLREYAALRAQDEYSPSGRRSAMRRLLDFYLVAVDHADRAALPARWRLDVQPVCSPLTPEFEGPRDAREWFADQYPAVEAAIGFAREHGFTEHAARIPLAMAGILDTDGPWGRAGALLAGSVEYWRPLGRPRELGHALYELARVRWRLHDLPAARDGVLEALAVWKRSGDRHGCAVARDQLGLFLSQSGDNEGALTEYRRALAGFRGLGEVSGSARVLNHMGTSLYLLGRYEAAAHVFREAIAGYRSLADRSGEAGAQSNYANILYEHGYYREAEELVTASLAAFRELGDRQREAEMLNNLGQLAAYKQDHRTALDHYQQVSDVFRELGDTPRLVEACTGAGDSLLELGHAAAARAELEAAAGVRPLCDPVVEARLELALGAVSVAQESLAEARLHYRNARELARSGVSRADEWRAAERLGDVCAREGRMEESVENWLCSAEILEGFNNPYADIVRMKAEMSGLSRMQGT